MRTYRLTQLLPLILLATTSSAIHATDRSVMDGSNVADSVADSLPTLAASEPISATPDFLYKPMTASIVNDVASEQEVRIARLEAELQEIRQSFSGNTVNTPQSVFSPPCSTCNRLYGSVEVTFLQPRISGAMPVFTVNNSSTQTLTSNFDTGVRYILGYRDSRGLGVRGRYWSYDHDFSFAAPYQPQVMKIDAQTADLEITQVQHFRNWDLELAGGIRYAKFGYQSDVAGAFGVGHVHFEGLGPTLALDARRPLGQSGLALFGNVRGSLLFGEIRNASMLLNMPRSLIRDEVAQTFENQLGISWTRTLSNNSQMEIRTAWETQYWMSDTLSDDSFGIGSNLGFMGPTVAVEFRY